MDNVAVVDDGVSDVLLKGMSGDGQAVAVQLGQQLLQHGAHTAGKVKVLDVVGAAGSEVRQQRDLVGSFVEVLPPRQVVARFVRDGGNVEDEVGGRRDCHVQHDGVLDGVLGNDLSGGDALVDQIHDLLTGHVGEVVDGGAGRAHGGVAGQGHAQSLGDHAHAVRGGHGGAGAADAPGVFDESVVLIHVHLAGLRRADLVLRMDMQDFLAAEGTQRHVAAGHHDGGDVQSRRAHQMAGDDGVTGGEQHHAVKEVAVNGQLDLIGDGVTAGDFDISGVLEHHAVADTRRHDLQRQAACFTNALLYTLGKLVKMYMAGVIFVPAVHHSDEGALLFFLGIAHAAHQSAAALGGFAKLPAASHVFILYLCHCLFHLSGISS